MVRRVLFAVVALTSLASSSAQPAPRIFAANSADQIMADVVLVNRRSEDSTVHVSPIKHLDCSRLDESVTRQSLGPEVVWLQKAGEAVALLPLKNRVAAECYGVRLQIDDSRQVYIMWYAKDYARRAIPQFIDKNQTAADIEDGMLWFDDRGVDIDIYSRGSFYFVK